MADFTTTQRAQAEVAPLLCPRIWWDRLSRADLEGAALSGHYLMYTHMEFENTKPSVVDHNTVKFRDMKNFDMQSFSNDLISYDILNGSQDNDDTSWERWKLANADICDKHALKKRLRLKKRSDPWMIHDIIKLMYECDHVNAKAK